MLPATIGDFGQAARAKEANEGGERRGNDSQTREAKDAKDGGELTTGMDGEEEDGLKRRHTDIQVTYLYILERNTKNK